MADYRRHLAVLAVVGCAGVVSCAHRAPEPVAPAEAPAVERPATTGEPAAAPAAAPLAGVPPAQPMVPLATPAETAAAAAADTPRAALPAVPPAAAPDTTSDEEFLDTLHALKADSAARRTGAVAPEVVQREAAAIFGASPAVTAAAAASWDIDVTTYEGNARVQAYIEYFTTRARGHFEIYLARLARYEGMIRERLRAGGLPQDLVYLALIESGMNPNAVSRKRAVGMWQFIQPTGRRYGLDVDPWVDERRDPFLSTEAAVRMLRELNDRFGSLYLAAAAYNSGPGKVSRGLSRYDFGSLTGNDVFFALAAEPYFRRETRDYVPKLIAAAIIAKQPERYGFTGIAPLPPLTYDSLVVRDAVGLDVLARLCDTTQAALEDLNPHLVRRMTPPGRSVWVRVPVGKAATAGDRLTSLPRREWITHVVHQVRRGETLGQIAGLYHVSVSDITAANRNLQPRSLRVGREITIPTSGIPSASRAAARTGTRPVARAGGSRTPARPSVVATDPAPRRAAAAPGTGRRVVHVVRSGETLASIARRFGVPLRSLLDTNRLTLSSVIHPGDTIRIPS